MSKGTKQYKNRIIYGLMTDLGLFQYRGTGTTLP